MSKVFVIPDVHLKPWMFEQATKLIRQDSYDRIVLLGDIMDDWGQERNLELYSETIEATVTFIADHPNTWLCYGNHDMSYVWQAFESGYSAYARELIVKGIQRIEMVLPEGHAAYMHRMDNVLFSHAGLTQKFVLKHFGSSEKVDIDYIIDRINKMGRPYMWEDDSPIWARPQDGGRIYPMGMMQVVGHTPVGKALFEGNAECGSLLTLDTFSTYSNGTPIGDRLFVWVDTEKMEYHVIETCD